MTLNLKHRSADDFASLTTQETSALLASASALRDADRNGAVRPALRGKNIGLLCDPAVDADDIVLVTRAAAALGARVAHIGPGLPPTSAPQRLRATSQLLGQLYDAVVCIGMTPDLVRHIANDAGIPVFDGIGMPKHPIAALADQWGASSPGGVGPDAPGELRSLLIQAVLLDALS